MLHGDSCTVYHTMPPHLTSQCWNHQAEDSQEWRVELLQWGFYSDRTSSIVRLLFWKDSFHQPKEVQEQVPMCLEIVGSPVSVGSKATRHEYVFVDWLKSDMFLFWLLPWAQLSTLYGIIDSFPATTLPIPFRPQFHKQNRRNTILNICQNKLIWIAFRTAMKLPLPRLHLNYTLILSRSLNGSLSLIPPHPPIKCLSFTNDTSTVLSKLMPFRYTAGNIFKTSQKTLSNSKI